MKKIGMVVGAVILLVIVLFGWWVFSRPERGTTGSVSTNFRWLGPNDKIVIDGFDDPRSRVSPVIFPGPDRRRERRHGRGGGYE